MVVLHVCVLSEGSWSSLTLNGKLSVNRRGASLKKNNHDLWLFFETKLISKCWTWNPYNLCQLNQCRGGGGGVWINDWKILLTIHYNWWIILFWCRPQLFSTMVLKMFDHWTHSNMEKLLSMKIGSYKLLSFCSSSRTIENVARGESQFSEKLDLIVLLQSPSKDSSVLLFVKHCSFLCQ